ncbi:MAG: BspA family leucine-rich repeat surface protein, partial [Proteobacteria bacterium]|nr:BspA family leucine-rich repeat surface protein [Pseudomonadota bacterium]
KSGVSFSAGDTKYSSGNAAVVAARALLTNSVASGGKNWTITDGGGQAGAPGVPTTVSGTAGSSQVSLSWSAPSDDGGSAITDYVVQYSANGSTWTSFSDGTSSLTSATVTGLTPGTAYVFQVAATNAAGTGSYSASSASVTPYTTPSAPTGVSGTVGNTQVSLSWTTPSNNGGALITDYEIQYSSNGGSSWIAFSDGVSTSTSAVVTGLANGTEYVFRVAAINAAGTGAYSGSSLGVIPKTTPDPPTGVSGTLGDTEVSLSWAAPSSNGGSAITDYLVQYSSNSGSSWTTFSDGTSTNTTATVTGLTNGTAYTFQVAAVNNAGQGSYSAQSSSVTPRGSFISTWKTSNTSTGSSTSTKVALPLESTGTYNFTVQWGDGTQNSITTWNDTNATHTYASAGTYTVTITGTITGFRFNNTGDRLKLTNISQFGTLNLGNNGSYFYGASNLTLTATDPLDLTGTTNLSYAFYNCSSLTTAPSMANWDTSKITNMTGVFTGATNFNESISNWNTENVTDMSWLFYQAYAFNQSIGNWNTANVTNMYYTFGSATSFNQDIGNWNTANVTTMSNMFNRAYLFNQPIGNWNTANVTNMAEMFRSITVFNQPIGNWNTANVTNMSFMFSGASAFNQNIGSWNT